MKLNRKFWRRNVRGLLSLSVLLGVCAMLLPLPFAPQPQNSPEKDSSEPFPCQHRPCGCRSAEQCWKKCCCFDQQPENRVGQGQQRPGARLRAERRRRKKTHAPSRFEICSAPASRQVRLSGHSIRGLLSAFREELRGGDGHRTRLTAAARRASSDDVLEMHDESGCVGSALKHAQRLRSRSGYWRSSPPNVPGQGPPAFCFPVSIIPAPIERW
jgi:hypothetical protein